jgi:MFS family permease
MVNVRKVLNTKFDGSNLFDENTLTSFILIINSFSWYFPLYIFFTNTLNNLGIAYSELIMIFGLHYATILISAFISATIAREFVTRVRLLLIWVLLGTISSGFMIILESNNLLAVYSVSLLMGVALGFGFPICLAYFANSVSSDRMGKFSGIALFAAFLGIFLVGFLTTIFSFIEVALMFTIWRAIGIIAFQTTEKRENYYEIKEIMNIGFKQIISERAFVLYVIPWAMFCLVNFFELPLQQYHWGVELSNIISIVEFGIGSVTAIIGGYFADIVGRKKLVILGYIFLGIGYAILSISPTNQIPIAIYAVLDGCAWGLFGVIFFLVIWSDLAYKKIKEKYYLLGTLPFLLSSYVSVAITPLVKIINLTVSFSLGSFFLFLAVIPLMYAPETLPEKVIRERELRSYIEKAKRIKERFTKG